MRSCEWEGTYFVQGASRLSLGPLLFLLCIDDLASLTLSDGSSLVLYADDILLFKPIASQADYESLKSDVHIIESWLQQLLHVIQPIKM